MHRFFLLLCSACASGSVALQHLSDVYLRSQGGSTFMLIAGMSGLKEMCVAAAGTTVSLEPCLDALATADGRELWTFSGGRLMSAASHLCMNAEKGAVKMGPCGSAAPAEILANGQLKLGTQCLSQTGSRSGVENVAAHAAASASSSAASHEATAAVDGSDASYWSSKFDESGPVELTVDLGGEHLITALQILWEFPAKSFSVALSSDGSSWETVYSTTVNTLSSTTVPVGSQEASKVKISMTEAHPVYGKFHGHSVYGIRSLAVSAAMTSAVVDDCASAAKSADARDKYFTYPVSEFDPAASLAVKGELPALSAATAALSATVNELAGVYASAR